MAADTDHAVPTNTEEWSTYEVTDDILKAFKHELMATSIGITSQTVLRPVNVFGTV